MPEKVTRLILICWVAFLSSCSSKNADADPAMGERTLWEKKLAAAKVAPDALQIQDGECLKLSDPPSPWTFDKERSSRSNGVVLTAKADAVAMTTPSGRSTEADWFSNRQTPSGLMVIEVLAWDYPKDTWGNWILANPRRLAKDEADGTFSSSFSPFSLPDGWRAYRMGPHPDAYYDHRRISQCRDYDDDLIKCGVISQQQDYAVFFSVGSKSVTTIPQIAKRLIATIDSRRGPC